MVHVKVFIPLFTRVSYISSHLFYLFARINI